jgi:predicted Zn-dependent peptidase
MRSPQGIAAMTLTPLLYGADSPYGDSGSGTVESVASITRDDLIGFTTRWIQPDNGALFVVSDLALDQIKPQLDEAFGQWASNRMARGGKDFATLAPAPEAARIVLVNRPNSPQSFIYGGYLSPVDPKDPGIEDLFNANNALGGNFLARMNMNLRETKGWSYGVRGGVSQREGAVSYMVSAPVQSDRTGDSLKELIREIDEFTTTNGVTAEELERIVNNEIFELPGQYETAGAVLGTMQSNVLYGRPMDYAETLADKYRAQTAESLDAAAREAIDINRFTWVIVGDAEKVLPQLEGIGLPIEQVELPPVE